MFTPSEISGKVLLVGPDDEFGGIGAVLKIYEKYIPSFKFISTYPRDPRKSRSLYFINAFYLIAKTLYTDKDIEIIHLHAASKGSFIRKSFIVLLGKTFQKKILFHVHGGSFKDFYDSAGFFRHYIAWVLQHSDKVICLSEDWHTYFLQVFPQAKSAVLHNPVEPAKSDSSWVFTPQLHLLFLGKICTEKGIFDLIDFLGSNHDFLNNRLCLHIAGKGDIDQLNELINNPLFQDRIIYHGWIDGAKKIELLSACDVYILPSHFEGLPMSILEAMAYGKPIIATDVGGISSLVHVNENGWLIEPRKLNVLTRIFSSILDDRTILSRYGNASLQKSKKYNSQEVIKQLTHLYQEVL